MKNKRHLILYVLFDYLAAVITWILFFIYRKQHIESPLIGVPVEIRLDTRLFAGMTLIPLFWLFLHFLSGYYRNVLNKSRLKELTQTFSITLAGVVGLHFLVILNDITGSFTDYYRSFFTLFTLQFLFTYLPRLIHTTVVHHRIISGPLAFRTLMIGAGKELTENIQYLMQNRYAGNKIVGVIVTDENNVEKNIISDIPVPGSISDLPRVIDNYQVEEVILAFPPGEKNIAGQIINQLIYQPVVIKAIPALYPNLLGRVKIQPLLDVPYLQIYFALMPVWQIIVKTIFDYLSAIIILILSSPAMLIIALMIKLTSKGPVIYSHERIGRHGKPFTLYKFRTMYQDAEINGPLLSRINDPRITPVGRFLRKTRLDELPNFINVLKGEMSIVGPRPERKYFIDRIMEKAPDYIHLQKVKPGITSWGQVRYGYAENIDQMVERLKYDLDYIKNMSLYVDFKILILTLLTIFLGKGK